MALMAEPAGWQSLLATTPPSAVVLDVSSASDQAWHVLKAIKLPGSGYRRFRREDIERMRDEMLSAAAPAVGMPDGPAGPVQARSLDDGELL